MGQTLYHRDYEPQKCINPDCKVSMFTPIAPNQVTCKASECETYRRRHNEKRKTANRRKRKPTAS